MTKTQKILDYWNKDGLCSEDSPTSHGDSFLVKIDNYFETRQLSNFIEESSIVNEYALDIGAGYGRLSRVLAKHFQHVVALEGADRVFAVFEQEMRSFDNVISIHGSFEDFADRWENQFDLILASGILYLYKDEMVSSFFEAVKKNLVPKGIVVLRDFVVQGERIYKKSSYVQDGGCYYRNRSFWNDLADQYGMNVHKLVKSKPSLSFLRSPRIIKIIKFFNLADFLFRIISVDKYYSKFIRTRESLTKKDNIYTVYIVIKNA